MVYKTYNNKTGGSDRIVGELLMYTGSGIVHLFEQLFSVSNRRFCFQAIERWS